MGPAPGTEIDVPQRDECGPGAGEDAVHQEGLMGRLQDPGAEVLVRFIKNFLHECASQERSVREQSMFFQRFMGYMRRRMAENAVWKALDADTFEQDMEGLERLITTKLYYRMFFEKGSEDAQKDGEVEKRIALHAWIEPRHLDLARANPLVLASAARELEQLDAVHSPREKIGCVIGASKRIYETIDADSADDFLPALIYALIQAKPAHLSSTVRYISLFRDEQKLRSEAGYYYTNFCAAVHFLSKLDRAGLTIDDAEYTLMMGHAVERLDREKVFAGEAREDSSTNAPERLIKKSLNFIQKIFRDETTTDGPLQEAAEEDLKSMEDYDLQLATALSLSLAESNGNGQCSKSMQDHIRSGEAHQVPQNSSEIVQSAESVLSLPEPI